jgi:hypothetical protein
MVSRLVCFCFTLHSAAQDKIFVYCQRVSHFLTWGILFDERTCPSPATDAGPLQRSHSQTRVMRDSLSYFALSYSRGLCIYFTQKQGGPVTTPDTGFPFRHLLLLVALRWWSNPHPWGKAADWIKVKAKLRPTVSRPVRPGVRHPSGTRDQLFFLLEIFFRELRAYFVAPSLTRGRVCNLLLLMVSPAQSRSGLSFAGLKTIFYCPNSWDSPNLEGQVPVFISPRNRMAQLYLRALGSLSVYSYDSQGYGGGILSRLHTGQQQAEVEVEVNLRPTVSRPVCLGVRSLGPATNFSFSSKFPSDSCGFVIL